MAKLTIEQRVEKIEVKLDSLIDATVDTLKLIDKSFKNTDINFEKLNKKIDSLHTDTHKGFKDVKGELKKIQETTGYDQVYANMKILKKKS